MQKCDIFEIRQEDGEIMEAIGNNNSAVTAIRVNGWENIYDIDESDSLLNGWNKEYYDDNGDLIAYVFDWERAGQTIGDSKYLRHLELRLGIFDPTQNVILFCRGLALNTSIESLVIDCHRYYRLNERESEEILSLTAQLFRELTPFFHNNTNLESLQWTFPWTFRRKMPWELAAISMYCIDYSKSLKSIILRDALFEKDVYWVSLIESICNKSLQHLTFQRCSLTYDAFCLIEGLLTSNESLLMSLSLACFDQEGSLTPIAVGLSQSTSIKCLKVCLSDHIEELMSPRFRTSLEEDPCWAFLQFSSLERFEIQGRDEYFNDAEGRYNDMVDLLRKMPDLRSLSIKTIVLESELLKDILANLPPKLQELKINQAIQNKHELQHLRCSLSSSTKINPRNFSLYKSCNISSLKKLDLSENFGLPLEAWTALLKSIHETELEELNLLGCNTWHSDTTNDPLQASELLAAVTRFLECNKKLRALRMHYIARVTPSSGWLAFSTALGTHPTLEELQIPFNNYSPHTQTDDTDGLDHIVRGVTSNQRLKQVRLTIDSFDQLMAIIELIRRPDCVLEELHITCHAVRDFNTEREDDVLTLLLSNALERNSSLKVVRFHTVESNDSLFEDTQIGYQPFCDLLGIRSSIDDTYNSNHSLQYLCFERQYEYDVEEEDMERDGEVPMKLYFLLNLNKDCCKRNVAIRKIIQLHTVENIKFDYSAVSNVISSVGSLNSKEGLSVMYEILRKMPYMLPKLEKINKIKKKRKAFDQVV